MVFKTKWAITFSNNVTTFESMTLKYNVYRTVWLYITGQVTDIYIVHLNLWVCKMLLNNEGLQRVHRKIIAIRFKRCSLKYRFIKAPLYLAILFQNCIKRNSFLMAKEKVELLNDKKNKE